MQRSNIFEVEISDRWNVIFRRSVEEFRISPPAATRDPSFVARATSMRVITHCTCFLDSFSSTSSYPCIHFLPTFFPIPSRSFSPCSRRSSSPLLRLFSPVIILFLLLLDVQFAINVKRCFKTSARSIRREVKVSAQERKTTVL